MFAEVQSASFPRSWEQAVEVLGHGPLSRPKPVLVRNFVLAIVSRFLQDELTSDEAQRLSAALRGTLHLQRAVSEAVLAEAGCAERLRTAAVGGRAAAVVRALALVPELGAGARDDVRTLLLEVVRVAPEDALADLLVIALDVLFLCEAGRVSISQLSPSSLQKLIKHSPRSELVERALELYLAANSFKDANDIAGALILPLLDFVTREHASQIMAASEVNSQIRGSTWFRLVREGLAARGLVAQAEE
jgi:hypothetical protein